jgi:pyruvate dehydrogenase E2 component (dihydrolipoamide acetyltransferase)
MAEFFKMPQASPTMEVGRLLEWKVREGDELAPQGVLAVVETDKAAMDIEVFDRLVVLKLLVPADTDVKVDAPIAIVGKSKGEDITALLASLSAPAAASAAGAGGTSGSPRNAPLPSPAPAPAPVAAPPAAAPSAAGLGARGWMGRPHPAGIEEMPSWDAGEPPPPAAGEPARVRAAPAARRAAAEHGVDLAAVKGSGPRGRVLRADVEAAPKPGTAAPAAAPAALASTPVRNSMMRKTIAKRLTAAWQDAPAFFLSARIDCDALVAFRESLKAAGVTVSVNDILLKAVARALREVPEVNASWGEDAILRHNEVHVGVAVALPDGLITPVVRHTDTKGLAAISAEVRALAGRAKDGKLKPEEYTGSTFTVSNLGMMGIEHFTAILNPPEACILAVGSLQQEPVVKDGALGIGWRMKLTLTCDHRVVDGALGARFLQALRRFLEAPALLAA